MDLHKRERKLGESGGGGGHMNNGSEHSCYGVDLRLHSTCMNRQKLRVCMGGDRLRPNKRLEVNPLRMYILLKILDILLL